MQRIDSNSTVRFDGQVLAQLACGHNQHVRLDPPWVNRPWVVTPEGRQSMLGFELDCKKCDEGAPVDDRPQAMVSR